MESNIVLISFTNTAESGVEDYILERSGNGMSYKYLQAVHPARNDGTSVDYKIKDDTPLTGLNLYRIRGREKDGRITYSPVIRLHTKSNETRLNIVPNPAHKGEISVQLTNLPGAIYKLSLYNAEGQLLLQQSLQHAGGSAPFP